MEPNNIVVYRNKNLVIPEEISSQLEKDEVDLSKGRSYRRPKLMEYQEYIGTLPLHQRLEHLKALFMLHTPKIDSNQCPQILQQI